MLREGLVHDDRTRAGRDVRSLYEPSLEQPDPHRLEVGRPRHDRERYVGHGPRLHGPVLDQDSVVALSLPSERDLARGAGHLDAWDLCHPVHQLLIEPDNHFLVLVRRVRQRQPQSQQILRHETGVNVLQVPEALHQEAGPDHEQEGQCDLPEHENGTCADTAPSGRGTAESLLQGPCDIRTGMPQQRRQSEQHAGCHRDPQREEQYARIDPDRLEPGNGLGTQGHESLDPTESQEKSQHSAGQRQERAFSQESPSQGSTFGSQRTSDRDFLMSALGPNEEEIGHVGARDKQYHRHRSEQDPQGAVHVIGYV